MPLLGVVGVVIIAWCFLPRRVNFDLSQTRHISAVGWPEGRKSEDYFLHGNLHVHIKLPTSKVYEDNVRDIDIERIGDQVRVIKCARDPQTLEDVYNEAIRLQSIWGFPLADLDAWRNEARRRGLSTYTTCAPRSVPGICLEIAPTVDSQRPWNMIFEISWITLAEFGPKKPIVTSTLPASRPEVKDANANP